MNKIYYKKLTYIIFLPCLIIILDQISKFSIMKNLFYGQRINIINNFFDLTLVYNTGAAFSFLSSAGNWKHYFFIVLAVLICSYLIYSIINNKLSNKQGILGASFIIGGALGNITDRFLHGHVIDFLLFYYKTFFYPAFNIADSFICLGAFLLIISSPNKQ